MHNIALYASGGLFSGISPVLVSAQFMSCSLSDDQGARGLLPIVCAYIFLFVGFRSIRYVLQLYGTWTKVAYLHFIYSLCALHDYECNQIVFILSTNKSVFILSISSASTVCFVSIKISRFRFSYFFLTYYLLNFVTHLILFTIPGSSRGVPVVGPSSSGQ